MEWFPLSYPESFYEKILTKPNVIAIGCFINTSDFESQSEQNEIMIGSIISKVKNDNEDITAI